MQRGLIFVLQWENSIQSSIFNTIGSGSLFSHNLLMQSDILSNWLALLA